MIKNSLTHIGGKPVEISEPFGLTRQIELNENKPEPIYDVKAIIHGLLESDEILNEIASDIGAKYMRRIGGPESKTVLIGYAKGTTLSDSILIDGRRFKVHTYIPRPLRCRKCQQYGHHESKCSSNIKCTRCGQDHKRTDCPDTAITLCSNCAGPHNADDRKCPKYITIQKTLEIRAREGVQYREAYKLATQELQNNEQEQIQTPKPDKQTTTELTINEETIQKPDQDITIHRLQNRQVQRTSHRKHTSERIQHVQVRTGDSGRPDEQTAKQNKSHKNNSIRYREPTTRR